MFIATGTGGKGILMGPVIGKAIADLVMNGEKDLKIGQFGLARFAAN